MRDIEFRCWSMASKTMQDWSEMEEHGEIWRLIKSPSYPVMQYTGLKDKNGVKIFEGDILKINDEIFRVEYIEDYMTFCPFTQQQFEWFKSGSNHFKYALSEDNDKLHFLFECESYEVEVIGSIYENPELLNT